MTFSATNNHASWSIFFPSSFFSFWMGRNGVLYIDALQMNKRTMVQTKWIEKKIKGERVLRGKRNGKSISPIKHSQFCFTSVIQKQRATFSTKLCIQNRMNDANKKNGRHSHLRKCVIGLAFSILYVLRRN